MTIREFVEKLRQHDYSMPIVIGNDWLYDDKINIDFDSEMGVVLSSPAINTYMGELVSLARGVVLQETNHTNTERRVRAVKALADWLEEIAPEEVTV